MSIQVYDHTISSVRIYVRGGSIAELKKALEDIDDADGSWEVDGDSIVIILPMEVAMVSIKSEKNTK